MCIPYCILSTQMVGIWVASAFWLLWIMLLWTWVGSICSCSCFYFQKWNRQILVLFKFRETTVLGNAAAVPLWSHQQCAGAHISHRVLFSSLLRNESESVKVFVAQSCPALFDPMDCSPPGSSFHGTLQVRILEWVAITFSKGSSLPRDRTWVSRIAGRFLLSERV